MTGYDAWTAAAVEARILEAAGTSMLMARDYGPGRMRSSAFLDFARDYGGVSVRPRPSPGALSRMEECEDWINRWLGEAERKTLRAWLWFKLQRGRTLSEYAEKSGLNSKTLRRFVIRCCAHIAGRLNAACVTVKKGEYSKAAEAGREPAARGEGARGETAGRPVRHRNYERAPDARPRIDTSPEAAKRAERAIAKSNKRLRRMRKKEG